MRLAKPHNEWQLNIAFPMDVHSVAMDVVMTKFWMAVEHDNRKLTRKASGFHTVSELVDELTRLRSEGFEGFEKARPAVESWVRRDLVRMVRRSQGEFMVVRPLHSRAARLRNPKRDKDHGASGVLYGWIKSTQPKLLDELKGFLAVDLEAESDVNSTALWLLGDAQANDVEGPELATVAPTCKVVARRYAEDVKAALAYKNDLPRNGIVESLKRISGLHLGLWMLTQFAVVNSARRGEALACKGCRITPDEIFECPYAPRIAVDCGQDRGSLMSGLAEESWVAADQLMGQYVCSHIALRKLDEFAIQAEKSGHEVAHGTLAELGKVAGSAPSSLFKFYFEDRLSDLVDQAREDDRETLSNLKSTYQAMGMDSYEVYVNVLAFAAQKKWHSYMRELVDSVLAKNTRDGLLAQPLGGARRRRFVLGSALLESLTLNALVEFPKKGAPVTRSIRIDELVDRLESRYGMHISKAPSAVDPSPAHVKAFVNNVERFRARLREAGLYNDVSDAYLAQVIKPRVTLGGRA